MNTKCRIMGVAAVSVALVLVTGCESPDGRPDNTATAALVGGAVGALAGAAVGGRHAGEDALIGALAGAVVGGLVGHSIDEEQRARLQQESPQTLQTIDHNDVVAQQQQQAQQASPPDSGQPPPAAAPTPLKVDDIKALTAAGVKPEAIINAIKESRPAPYSAQDIETAQQANPPVDPSVIAYMQNPTS